jgi:cephalosporin hydroxylase
MKDFLWKLKKKYILKEKTYKKTDTLVPEDEIIDFSPKTIFDGHHKTSYRGVKAIRCPFDYVIYQMILFELKPDLIIEIGTNAGGGALYLADLLNIIGNGEVHTIDIVKMSVPEVAEHPRIKIFTEGWEKYDLNLAKRFDKVLVIEDGSHMYQDSLDAMTKFQDIVSIGSYLIVEDGIINEMGMEEKYKGGPLKAIREFLEKNHDYKVDRKWCDFFGKNATFNVNGYLKRIR